LVFDFENKVNFNSVYAAIGFPKTEEILAINTYRSSAFYEKKKFAHTEAEDTEK
jgi:hypothetical protein